MAASPERAFVDAVYALLNDAATVGGTGVAVLKGDRSQLPANECALIVPKSVEITIDGRDANGLHYTENCTVEIWVEYTFLDTNASFDAHSDMAGVVRDLVLADETLSGTYDIVEIGETTYDMRSRGDQITRRATIPLTAGKEHS